MRRTLILATLFATVAAWAQPPQGGQGRDGGPGPGGHRGPPQEAFDACKGKKEGDHASATMPRGDTMTGTCRMVLVPAEHAGHDGPGH
jgi:hypothetical protein